jgi:hemolysin activation/secretion protein
VLRDRLTWLKRDPRIDAITAELVPGDAPGSSRLSVVVDEARPWWVSAQADNATPPSIGEYGGLFQVGHRNLTGWGDSLMISFRQTEGLSDVEGYFEVPLTRWETTLELRGRYADADVVEPELSQLELNSEATVLGARIRQPVLRSSNYEARLFVGIERKTGRATLGGDPGLLAGLARDFGTTRTAAVRMGAEAWWRGRHRAFAGRGTLSLGFDGFGASNGTSFSQPNEEFVTGLVQLQGVEYLPWYRLRIHTRVDFQITDGPLLSLEQLAMGGVDSVRGFRENILVRDEGVVASLEVRVPLWTFGPVERFELGVFTDYGYGRNQKGDLPFKLRSERLMSVGLGLHADVTPWIQASAQWAGEILEPSGNDGDGDGLQDHGFHFLLRVFFP